MKKVGTLMLVVVTTVATFLLFFARDAQDAPSASAATREDRSGALSDIVAAIDRTPVNGASAQSTPASAVSAFPASPRNAEELQELVRWMKSLPREQLLLLTNAEYGFEKSDLIAMLQSLEGDWVIAELARLAGADSDDLVRATLAVGLLGRFSLSRSRDPGMIVAIRDLLPSFAAGASDPFGAARWFGSAAYSACVTQKHDIGALLLPHLAESDNTSLLQTGYLYVGLVGGSESAIADAFLHHSSPSGRFGALEALRHGRGKTPMSPEEIAAIGSEALRSESDPNNRMLIVEMLGASGGDAGIDALREIVRTGSSELLGHAASMLATKLPPNEALETISTALQGTSVSEQDRASLYQALGVVESEEARQKLLGVAGDRALSDTERLQGLRGLWHRPMDTELATELGTILESDAPAALRAESLKMLATSPSAAGAIDVKAIATTDEDAAVRREAVLLSALEGGPDQRGWLEERLLNDRSPDVKAAALGAMVMQAHYAGDGDAVLDHLGRVRRMTDDPGVLGMVEQGEKMVRAYDPRNLELQLKGEAELYGKVSKYVTGPAQRDFQRRAAYLEKMVQALGAGAPR